MVSGEKVVAKRVELSELFFDLVFVYAISCSTALLRQVESGLPRLAAVLSFATVIVVLVNSWMVETVFTNRFGSNSRRDVGFMLASMVLVLLLSANLSADLVTSIRAFSLLVGAWTLLLLVQYALRYRETADDGERSYIRLFFLVLGLRVACLAVAALLEYPLGLLVLLVGVVLGWVLPGLLSSRMRVVPINFPHLTERLSLLVIISFGETIVDVAGGYFGAASFSLASVLVFVLVATLFVTYVVEFDGLARRDRAGITGNGMIYLHYPVLFGISSVTVALSYLAEGLVSRPFAVCLLYAGLALFQLGVLLGCGYNSVTQRPSAGLVAGVSLAMPLGLAASLVSGGSTLVVVGLACASSVVLPLGLRSLAVRTAGGE